MIRAVFFMLKVGVLVAAAVWVANRPGTISIDWLEYELTVDVGLFFVALLLLILVAIFFYSVMKGVADFPKSLKRYNDYQRREKGYRALTLGLTAVAAGDGKSASYQAHRARKFMTKDTGLPLLLEAQAARMAGREDDARASFAALLENKDAAFLGVRGLLQTALDLQNYTKALELARAALKMHPKQPWILRVVYDLEIKQRDWAAARDTLNKAEKAGAIEAAKAKSDRVSMLLAEADQDLEEDRRAEAFKKLKKAQKYDPAFVPAATRLAKLYVQRRARRKAVSVIEKAWKAGPHPELVPVWELAAPKPRKRAGGNSKSADDPMVRLKWFEKLLKLKPGSAEGHMAVAQAAMDDGLWGEARSHLKLGEEIKPGARLYKMLAELEERSTQNEEAAMSWHEKAEDAAQEKGWVCAETGRVYREWAPIAEPHGSFNTIVWDEPQGEDSQEFLAADNAMADAFLEAPKS